MVDYAACRRSHGLHNWAEIVFLAYAIMSSKKAGGGMGMKMPRSRLLAIVYMSLVSVLAPRLSCAAFTLTPGTLLGVDNVNMELIEYSTLGVVTERLRLSRPMDYTGLAVVGNEVFVSERAGSVQRVNLVTGNVTLAFDTHLSNELSGLGDDGTNLLALGRTTGRVDRHTRTGTFLDQIIVQIGSQAIDGNAAQRIIGDSTGTRLLVYPAGGGTPTAVSTGLPGGTAITGLGYDPISRLTWIATGFSDDLIRAYDSSGILRAQFSAQSPQINGLDFVPLTTGVPEPWVLNLLGIGMLGIVVSKRRDDVCGRLRTWLSFVRRLGTAGNCQGA